MSKKGTANQAMANAAREAAAKADRRAIEIVNLCGKYDQAKQAPAMILSDKTVDQVEAELKRSAAATSWDNAIARTGGAS